MMDEMFVWVFIAFAAVVFVGMLYDNLKCKHEWEHHEYYLICKKCGKVKVIK